ncbi:MAG: glycosyltransferase [Candidatus Obscuribacterales bacterium]|nr:glycosyltransferase [Candidatus Obscuribacterales bacterium]
MSNFSRRILLITLEPISKKMAGPAIRCVEIAKQLAKEHEVTVFSPQPSDFKNSSELCSLENFKLFCQAGKSQLYNLAANQDIIFLQANVLKPYPGLVELGKYLVVDLYDPFLLAVLAQFTVDSTSASASYRLMHQVLKKHMVYADFSVCASEKQLDYWLGRYCAIGRLSPEMYAFDRSFRKLIDVLPFGLPEDAPQRTAPGLKGKLPGIDPDDFLLIWGGGIWEWFDPITIIKAVALLAPSYPQLKLYFMGYQSPNPQVGLMQMAVKAREIAEQLGILDKHVFFAESWTPYDQRVNCLLDADLAVSAHFDSPETRFSFRTRILDYLWVGLPILTTTGDQLAEEIERGAAGMALPYEDTSAWTAAIEKLILDKSLKDKFAQGSAKLAESYHWDKAVEPLRRFCNDPYHPPAFKRIKMPNLVERAKAVYERGGKDLIVKRSREIIKDVLRG